jgi:putative heme-binding domain-containing protein
VNALVGRQPQLASALLTHEAFVAPAHLALVPSLGTKYRLPAARRFLVAVRKDRQFIWSGELVDLLASLPGEEVKPLFRQKWREVALRERLLLLFALRPEALDREKYLWGLEASNLEVIRACLSALLKLPRDNSTAGLVPMLRLLKRLAGELEASSDRERVLKLLQHQTGVEFQIREGDGSRNALHLAYQPVFDWFRRVHPALVRGWAGEGSMHPSAWDLKKKSVRWPGGDAHRGGQIYQELGCAYCHEGPRSLGPSLRGMGTRLSRELLFESVLYPHWQVPDSYRTTVVVTRDGMKYDGTILHEGPEMLLLQTGSETTVRLYRNEIFQRYKSRHSLMPAGLIDQLASPDLAALDAFLGDL